jgi:hypothetical protein
VLPACGHVRKNNGILRYSTAECVRELISILGPGKHGNMAGRQGCSMNKLCQWADLSDAVRTGNVTSAEQ